MITLWLQYRLHYDYMITGWSVTPATTPWGVRLRVLSVTRAERALSPLTAGPSAPWVTTPRPRRPTVLRVKRALYALIQKVRSFYRPDIGLF